METLISFLLGVLELNAILIYGNSQQLNMHRKKLHTKYLIDLIHIDREALQFGPRVLKSLACLSPWLRLTGHLIMIS